MATSLEEGHLEIQNRERKNDFNVANNERKWLTTFDTPMDILKF